MNSSAVSIYDNVGTPEKLSKSFMYRKLNDLLHLNTEIEARIFCPLCVNSFSFKFSLFEHLRTFHENFLTQASNQTLKFKECPFCQAKLYGKHLAAKHVLHHHSKVIKELFINKNGSKCFFCNVKLNKGDLSSVVNHIGEFHFLDFEEEFRKMFTCDTSQEVPMSELINSTIQDKSLQCTNFKDVSKDVSIKFEKHSTNLSLECQSVTLDQCYKSDTKDFDEASKINCYDFTELKQQLEDIKNKKGANNSGVNTSKSVLKDIKNFNIPKRSARRVLRFDLPFNNDEDKENSASGKNFCSFKQICVDEPNLSCNSKASLFFKPNNTFNESPQHSSTPNFKCSKILKEDKKNIACYKSSFKSYINEKKITDFEFQCGKCRLLFKENLELVSHIKNNHKKFSLTAFQPCYHCAICNARFYRNRYLKKHHNLHKPY